MEATVFLDPSHRLGRQNIFIILGFTIYLILVSIFLKNSTRNIKQ